MARALSVYNPAASFYGAVRRPGLLQAPAPCPLTRQMLRGAVTHPHTQSRQAAWLHFTARGAKLQTDQGNCGVHLEGRRARLGVGSVVGFVLDLNSQPRRPSTSRQMLQGTGSCSRAQGPPGLCSVLAPLLTAQTAAFATCTCLTCSPTSGRLGASREDSLFPPLKLSQCSPFQAGVGQGGQSFAHVAVWLFSYEHRLSRGVCELTLGVSLLAGSPSIIRGPAAVLAGGQSRARRGGAGRGREGLRGRPADPGLLIRSRVPCSQGDQEPP